MDLNSYDLIEPEETSELDFNGNDDEMINFYCNYYADLMSDEDIENLEIRYGK